MATEQAPVRLWDPDGVAVTTALGNQVNVVAAADMAGGAVFVWMDPRASFGAPDLFAERIDGNGLGQWEPDGAPFVNAPASQGYADSMSDGAGGAIVVWEDFRSGQTDIYAQRISADGVALWQVNGVPISTACWPGGLCANQKRGPKAVADGAGGAILTWGELRDGLHLSVWAQRVSSQGIPLWTANGVPVASGDFHADSPEMVSDGAGGAIVVWQDGRNQLYNIYAQRLDPQGNPLWIENGVRVSPSIAQRGPRGHALVSDADRGAIITWVDGRGDPNDSNLYAQRVDSAGVVRWQNDGLPLSTAVRHQYSPVMIDDEAGGAIVAWEDQSQARQRILAQRVSAEGAPLWEVNGIPLCPLHCHDPDIVADDAGGAIIVADGFRFTHGEGPSLYAQRVDGTGRILWGENGFEVHHQPNGNYLHGSIAVEDGGGGAVIAWLINRDTGGGFDWDVFAQRVSDQIPVPSGPYRLGVTKSGGGTGTVSSLPLGIDCGSDCDEDYDTGTVVSLSATPDTDSEFTGWHGHRDCWDGSVTMNADKRCTATFEIRRLALIVTIEGTGTGRVTSGPAGINCGHDCGQIYLYGTIATLTATADADSIFTGWRGDTDCSDGALTMIADRTCTASFTARSLDPDLKPGFPVHAFHDSGSYQGGPPLHTLVGSIDGDPELEILVTALANGPLHAWNQDGTLVQGWPLPLILGPSYPALGELDPGLPGLEIVAGHQAIEAKLAAYSGSGNPLPGWPKATNFERSPPATRDIDGDGIDEIFTGQEDRKLHAYRGDGSAVTGWPVLQQGGGQTRFTPAISDLDGDGDLEVITASDSVVPGGVFLHAFHHDGSPVNGFPVTFEGWNTFPAVGDVDGDGHPEIVVLAWVLYEGPAVLVISGEGAVEKSILLMGPVFYATAPALADLDGDCVPEIVVQTDGALNVLRGDGSAYPGWPALLSGQAGSSSPVVGDVDGDQLPDIVITHNYQVRVYGSDGTLNPSFPKNMNAIGTGAVPAIADIDLDGRNDIIVTGDFWNGIPGYYHKAWAFDLGGPPHGAIHWGQFMGGASHDGEYRCPGRVPPRVSVAASAPLAREDGPMAGSLTITRSGPTLRPLEVFYTTAGSAGAWDHVGLRGSVTIGPGESGATITVTPVDDTLVEKCETVIVTLSPDPGYTLRSPTSATVFIASDDGRRQPCVVGRNPRKSLPPRPR